MSCCPPRNEETFDPDHEGPSAEDIARFGCPTRPCPGCRKEIYDEVDWCPNCGHAFSSDEMVGAKAGGKAWVVVTGVVVIAAFVLVFVL